MRPGPLLGSLAAHVALVVVAARWAAAPTMPAAEQEPRAVWIEAPPIEVAIVEDSNAPAAGGRPAASGLRPQASGLHGLVAVAASSSVEVRGPRPEALPESGVRKDDRTPGSLYMHMRGPEFHLPDSAADAILDHPLPPPPQVERSGRLESAPGGTAVVNDAVTTVAVERDGTAHFHDKPDVDVHFHLPLPSFETLRNPERALREAGNELGQSLRDWYADPYKAMRKGPATDLPDHLKAEPGQCDQFGALNCEPPQAPPPGTIASGNADLTAYLMRKFHVGDPYAARKRALLDATRAERVDRGGSFRSEQLARSAELMHANLERLWATTRDPAARRAALFALWDECAEGEGPAGEAGERARAEAIGWIRAHLPAGSRDAYGAAELAELAAHRSSHQQFEPY